MSILCCWGMSRSNQDPRPPDQASPAQPPACRRRDRTRYLLVLHTTIAASRPPIHQEGSQWASDPTCINLNNWGNDGIGVGVYPHSGFGSGGWKSRAGACGWADEMRLVESAPTSARALLPR